MTAAVVRDHFVYWMFDADGNCLYVGMTHKPEQRWRSHRGQKPEMVAQVAQRRMAGPYPIETARRIEREQQVALTPRYVALFMPSWRSAVRPDSLKALCLNVGIETDQQLADQIGMHRTQVVRVLRGQCEPGNRFIAGVIDLFGPDKYLEIFETVRVLDEVAS